MNIVRTIRNNWKKSVLGVAALSYGASYVNKAYDSEQLMRSYCEDAAKYGDHPIPPSVKPRHVTVILNPAAKNRKSKKLFDKYCAPLLHLAGIAITIIQTESEGQARRLISNLNTHTDAIVVAGGDGTLCDAITGLMRKCQSNLAAVKQCPVGILPLGNTNKVARSIFHGYDELADIRELADATMAIVRGSTKMIDVVEIEPLEQNLEQIIKPIYAASELEWGAWRDAHERRNKYWYWGALRRYVTYIFSGYKSDLNWDCEAVLKYTEPCNGCSKCYNHKQLTSDDNSSDKRWWHTFIPRKSTYSSESNVDYSKVINEKCGVFHEVPLKTTDLHMVVSNNVKPDATDLIPSLRIELAPKDVDYWTFVAEGWRREHRKQTLIENVINVKDFELRPTITEEGTEKMFYIDNEEFEFKPIKARLLPQSVKIFCQ